MGFQCGLAGKESACNEGDLGLVPGLGRSPGEGKGYPLQYSGLENSIDCIVHGVAESDTTEPLSLSVTFGLISECGQGSLWGCSLLFPVELQVLSGWCLGKAEG